MKICILVCSRYWEILEVKMVDLCEECDRVPLWRRSTGRCIQCRNKLNGKFEEEIKEIKSKFLELKKQVKCPLYCSSNTQWESKPNSHLCIFDATVKGNLTIEERFQMIEESIGRIECHLTCFDYWGRNPKYGSSIGRSFRIINSNLDYLVEADLKEGQLKKLEKFSDKKDTVLFIFREMGKLQSEMNSVRVRLGLELVFERPPKLFLIKR